MTALVAALDADFNWLAGGAASRARDLRLPPGGVDTPEGVEIVRSIHEALGGDGHPGAWLMVADGEVVGLCGFVRPWAGADAVEIGYGVAPARRGRGHARRAVAAMIAIARSDPAVKWVTAVTAETNTISQGVLTGHGFRAEGREVRDLDGPVILWRLAIR